MTEPESHVIDPARESPLVPAVWHVDVFVPGRPAPQGSKRYLGKGISVESSKAVAPWRTDIRDHVRNALPVRLDEHGQPFALVGIGRHLPVLVDLEFVMPRPVSVPKSRTPAASKRPDLDKLARAVLDALGSAQVWCDDAQVVDLRARKRMAGVDEPTGCRIRVAEVA